MCIVNVLAIDLCAADVLVTLQHLQGQIARPVLLLQHLDFLDVLTLC